MLTFTIITCTYNAEHELQRTLDSVRTQTYAHVQHLIIDGLSTDSTVAMARAYADECKAAQSRHAVEVASEADKGLYDAMNKGLSRAKGDYLVFLNAGDTLADDTTLERIAMQVRGIAADELPAVIYGDTDIVDDNGNFLHRRRLQPPERLTWKSFLNGMLVCHQAFYARTDIARATPYNLHYRFSADVDWCIRVMKSGTEKHLPLHNTHITLCRYLDGGLTVKNHRTSLIERFRVMASHYGTARTVLAHLGFVLRSLRRGGIS